MGQFLCLEKLLKSNSGEEGAKSQTEIVEELIKVSAKHGINLEMQNKEGDTALHVAASSILNC